MNSGSGEGPSSDAITNHDNHEPRESRSFLSMGFWVIAILTVGEIGFLCAFTDFPLKVMSVSPPPIRALLAKVVTVPPDVLLDGQPASRPATQARTTRPRTRLETLSALSRQTPSDEVCTQLAQMAHEDSIGTKKQASDPGTMFVRQVVMCVHTKHWPAAMVSDPAVNWAISEMKDLQKSGVF